MVLAAPAPAGVAPVALSPGVSAAEEDELRLVGFGRSGALARDEGARREGVAAVDAVNAFTLRLRPSPSQPCIGDSGGPAFATIAGVEHLVGVTSTATVCACRSAWRRAWTPTSTTSCSHSSMMSPGARTAPAGQKSRAAPRPGRAVRPRGGSCSRPQSWAAPCAGGDRPAT